MENRRCLFDRDRSGNINIGFGKKKRGLNCVEERVQNDAGPEISGLNANERQDKGQYGEQKNRRRTSQVLRNVDGGEKQRCYGDRPDRSRRTLKSGIDHAAIDDLFNQRSREHGKERNSVKSPSRTLNDPEQFVFLLGNQIADRSSKSEKAN